MIRQAQQTGYILLPVIVVITLVAAIALLMNTESALESNTAATELDAQQAQYVAEAGMNHALWLTQQQGCGVYSDLTGVSLGNDQYTTILTTDLGSTTSYSITVDQDSWIRNDLPTINKATDLKLHTRFETGNIERPLLRYDLSSIPANSKILSATAWFFVTNVHPEGPVDIHVSTTDWLETDATWDSMGDKIDKVVMSTIPPQATANVWVSANLTSQVQAWVNGQTNYGITLNSTSEGSHGQYNSIESANPPYLEVIVGGPPTSPATLKAAGTLANGTTRSITRDDVILNQQPQSFAQVRVTPGTGKDAVLDSFYNNRNHGDYRLDVDSVGTLEHVLIQFDVPAIPPGARILSARLGLYHTITNGTPVNPGIDIHRVTRDWIEGTMSGTGTADGATWDTWDGSNTWTQAGGDFDIAPVASDSVSAAIIDWESWEIGELVQGWIDDTYPNYGLLLKGTGSIDVSFASKEDADPELHPRLLITYACACGEICVTPQGSGNLLMVVINPTTLVAEDQQAKDLFESWGYTVSVISESANQSIYDAAFAANDVVFISETVNSTQVGTKTASAAIGVVSQDRDYNPDLGLATGGTLKVGSDIDITNTDHFITRPFPVGTLPIYTAGMEQLVTTGALTADQQTLTEIGGDASLVVLDQGAAMEGGGNAAGRRVVLPLGTRYRFNWDHLNANGRLLVQRALQWGAGAGKVSKGNLLLVVVNPGSLTPQESAKKALFESWGYNVNLIDESDTQPDFDAAVAANDVVYITEDVSSGSVNTKLVNAAIGVVTEEDNLLDEFGMAASIAWESGTQVEINDNSHYITSPFSLGSLTILTANESLAYVTGTQSPDLGRLASSTSGYGVVTLEAGAALFGGGSAAGRRAQLPWGGDNFDVNHLNDDGLTILQRALEWGAGAENPDFSTELLFVVADPSALTVAESAKKSLIESWGFTVNLIDDADSLANFATAFGINGVIYVSGEVSDSAIGSKLTKAGIGIVNEQIALHDELLLSTSSGTNAFSNIMVIDNTHYITQGINTGWHTIASSNQPLNALMGTLAPGMINLAEVWISGANYDFGLAVVDTGGQLNAGEIAAGRRAQLPWGTASFDFNTLNDNGKNLMKRAIEWAGGAEIDLSPFALWKLDETTGPVAVDSEGGNDGTWTNDPVPASGVIDGGLDFDGSNDNVDVGSFDVIGSGITMMAWFNAEALTTADERIISKADGTAEAEAWWQLSSSNSGADRFLRMRIKAGGTTTTLADSSVNLATDTWYLAAATYDNASGTMRLYLDGVEIASRAHTVGGALDVDPSVPIAIGANGTAERFFNGILDEVHIYNRALDASEIQDYYAANAPVASEFFELYQPWSASNDNTWETVDLAPFGVPANAVVEVAVTNSKDKNERWGGVRAVGSSLERRFQLHESEGGGLDVVTMHVQTDASSQIQHYADKKAEVTFTLLGYWTGASYIELFEPFSADSNNNWVTEDVSDDGLGANQVAEIAMANTNQGVGRLAGLRSPGAAYQRRFDLHEAESGGVEALTLMVVTSGAAEVEVFAESAGDIDFYVLGFWSTPPGTYTETGGVHGQALSASTWELTNLTGLGVPANTVAQFVVSNEVVNFARSLGVREVGSGRNRVIELQEAEPDGSDLASMHVNVDSASNIEWYSGSGTTDRYFYPVGWWVLSP